MRQARGPRAAATRSGTRHDGGRVEVELVEPADPVEPPATPDAPRRARTRARRRTAWLAAGVLAAVAVTGANVAERSREQDRRAALAAVPGLLAAPADAPLQQTWRRDGTTWPLLAGDLVLVTGTDGRFHALDATTGRDRWTRDVRADGTVREYCSPLGAGPVTGYPTGGSSADGVVERLLCQRVDVGTSAPPRPASLRVVTAATGDVLQTFTGTDRVVFVERVEDDLVVFQSDTDGHALVTRWDVGSGEREWDLRSAGPVFSVPEPAVSSLERRGGTVVLTSQRAPGHEVTVAVDTARGTEVPGVAAPTVPVSVTHELPLDGGRSARWVEQTGEASGGSVRDASGAVLHRFDGVPLGADVDDGSAPGVLVTALTGASLLRGLDPATGAVLWEREVPTADAGAGAGAAGALPRGLALVEGRLALAWSGRALAVDLEDGALVWDVAASGTLTFSGMTDGERLLLPRTTDDGGHDLVAVSLADGSPVWRTRLPAALHAVLATPDGQVVATGSSGLVGLG